MSYVRDPQQPQQPQQPAGAGSWLKQKLSGWGIPACGGCQRRADLLDRWFPFNKK